MPSLDEIFSARPTERSSLDDIFGEQDVPRGAVSPQQAFLEAAPGSAERVAALDAIDQERIKKDRAESLAAPQARPQIPEIDSGIPDPLNLGVKAINALMPEGLPQGLASVATMAGGPASKIPVAGRLLAPINAGLAAAGGAVGVEADELMRQHAGLPAPPEGEIDERIKSEALKHGGAQLAGEAVLGGLGKLMGARASAATRAAFDEAEKHGIPTTMDKLSDGTTAKILAGASSRVPGGGYMFRKAAEDAQSAIESKASALTAGLPPKVQSEIALGENIGHAIDKTILSAPAYQAGITQQTEMLAAGLPPKIASEVDFGRAWDDVLSAPDRGILPRLKVRVSEAYDAGRDLLDLEKDRVVNRNAFSEALAIKREEGKGLQSLNNKELAKVVDEILSHGPQKVEGVTAWRKLDYDTLDTWRRQLGDKAFGGKDPLFTPVERQLSRLYRAVEKDIDNIPNPAAQLQFRRAKDLHRDTVVPFSKGESSLNNLLQADDLTRARMLTGPRAEQTISDLMPYLSPDHVTALRGQIVGDIMDNARNSATREVDPKKFLAGVDKSEGALRALMGPVELDNLRNSARGIIGAADQGRAPKEVVKFLDAPPLDRARMLTGSRGAQTLRAIKPYLPPDQLDTIQGHVLNEMLDSSRDRTSKAFLGSEFAKQIQKNRGLLTEIKGAPHVADMEGLARAMTVAQKGMKPAVSQSGMDIHRAGVFAGAGGVMWGAMYHPGTTAMILLPANAIAALMSTPAGVRYLAKGFAPAAAAMKSQGARVAAGLAAGIPGHSSREEIDAQHDLEQNLPPVVKAQVEAVKPGPNGEPPKADIGGERHPYDPLIAVASEDSKVSPQLMKALFLEESGLNPKAKSKAGAQGVAQFMPGTAKGLGVRDPYDATEAIPAATAHVADLLQRYDGDKAKALAAYNAGPGAVDKYGGVPPYPETQKYVRKVLEREQRLSAPKPLERLATLLSINADAAVPPPQPLPTPGMTPTPGPQGAPPEATALSISPAVVSSPEVTPAAIAVDPVIQKAASLGHRNARMNFYTDVIQRVQMDRLPPQVMADVKQIYSGRTSPYEKAEKIASLLVQRGVVALDDKGRPSRMASWPEIAQQYQKAKKSGNEDEWKGVRRLINQRVKSKIQDPTLGMHPNEYRRFLPMISEALKPEGEPVSVAARG